MTRSRLFLLAALAAFLLWDAVRGGTLFLRDINMVWLPQVETFVHCVAGGSWPLWDPYSGFGRPLLADPRVGVLYPPTWLNLLLPPATAYTVLALGHLVLAGVGLHRLMRHWGVTELPALAAAAVWMASGPLLSLVSMWHHLAGAAWMPWVVLAVDRALGAPTRRRVAAAAVLVAVQVLAGSPDYSALTLLVAVLLGLMGPAGAPVPRRAAVLGAVLALGAVLSAAQWWPTLDVVLRSARRGQEAAAATTWSAHPWTLLELLVPLRWADLPLTNAAVAEILEAKEPWLRSVYLGLASFPLVVAGALSAGPRRRALVAVLGLGLLLAIGAHGPLAPVLTGVPGLRALRFPVKALVPVALAWAALFAFGLEAVAHREERARRIAIAAAVAAIVAAGLVAMAAAGAFGLPPFASRLAAPPTPRLAVLAMAFGLALAVAALLASTRHPRAVMAIAVLAVADVAGRHRELNPAADRRLFARRPQTLELLDLTEGARTYVYDYSMDPGPSAWRRPAESPYDVARVPEDWPLPVGLVLGVHEYLNPPTAARWRVPGSYDMDILGFDPRPVAALVRRLREVEDTPAHLRLLQLGAVRNVVALVPAAWWQDLVPAGTREGYFRRPIQAMRAPDPLPRAALVAGVRIAEGDHAIALLTDAAFDPRGEVVLPSGEPAPAAPAGTVLRARIGCDQVALEVDAERPGHLVLVDAYDPGWRATVDGQPAPLVPANVAFRAVPVPPGRHVVEMKYRPPAVFGGIVISLAGVAAVAAALLRGRPKSSR